MNFAEIETMITNRFKNLPDFLKIAHHMPGRIRLKVSRKIKTQFESAEIPDFKDFKSLFRGISSIKINRAIGSITIEYDTSIITPGEWEHFVIQSDWKAMVPYLNKEELKTLNLN